MKYLKYVTVSSEATKINFEGHQNPAEESSTGPLSSDRTQIPGDRRPIESLLFCVRSLGRQRIRGEGL